MHTVDVLCIAKVSTADGLSKRLCCLGNSDKMNMICHQTITQYIKTMTGRFLIKKFQINTAVVINKKDILLIVAPLSNMMRQRRHCYSRKSRHSSILDNKIYYVNLN